MSALAIIGGVMALASAFVGGLCVGINTPYDPDDVQKMRDQLARADADRRALIDERDTLRTRLEHWKHEGGLS